MNHVAVDTGCLSIGLKFSQRTILIVVLGGKSQRTIVLPVQQAHATLVIIVQDMVARLIITDISKI
jgi:hypothetical protein